ncbi:MAG: HAD-IIIA family hydrolase [Planctomycetaceae bacterium]|nr:HAD-IIIA family hydrolase [Planctomycetaceae bacterium]
MDRADFLKIKLLILDVDGVLTDGGIIVHADGTESKRFHVMDGHRIRMWQRAGGIAAILSGRQTAATEMRARQLEIEHVLQGCTEKLPAFEELLKTVGLDPSQVAYVGDDVIDIPLVRRAGFGAAVANAAEELKRYAQYVTSRRGGQGAVAEIIEYLLKQSGRWDQAMERYLI